ncbi:MAG: phosphatidate cytidylyltransferase [Thermodesulfovibrionales bacterium]
MHFKRLIVALFLLPLFYLYIMYLSSEYFLLLLIIAGIIAIWEFNSMYNVEYLFRYAGIISGVTILIISYIFKDILLDIILLSFILIISTRLFFKRNPVSSLSDVSPTLLSLLYIPCLLTFQNRIREPGPEWVILLYAMVWSADTFAYYTGTLIGGKKLYVEVSPKKTIAGAIGSVVGGAAGAIIVKTTILPSFKTLSALVTGIIVGSITVIGDLVESMFKRDAGVKDSGVIIPGHGGILDKIDGVLFAGPILYWILLATKVIK